MAQLPDSLVTENQRGVLEKTGSSYGINNKKKQDVLVFPPHARDVRYLYELWYESSTILESKHNLFQKQKRNDYAHAATLMMFLQKQRKS